MKRKTLTTAVLAGIGGVAGIANISGAVNLNPDGLGEALIYPFFTVNGGNDTLISVVNTTADVKAVKVRFLESKNSREVLDFNLYLSPFDVWVAAVTSPADETAAAVLIQPDGEETCTVPAIPDGGVSFRTLLLNERVITSSGPGSIIDNSPARTREGHVEMIEMGVIREGTDDPSPFRQFTNADGLASSAIHGPDGVPDCSVLSNAWSPSGGIWSADSSDHDVTEPEGGLFGGASIINVFGGFQVSYNAEAIDGFFDIGVAGSDQVDAGTRETLHAAPGSEFPNLGDVDTRVLTGDADLARTFVFNMGRVIQSDWDKTRANGVGAFDAVSALFMHDEIFNEYAIDTALNGATEWVVTFPTKRPYVASDNTRSTSAGVNPFSFQFGETFGALGACEFVRLDFADREERGPGPGDVDFSPSAGEDAPFLCLETQVVTFGQPTVGLFTGVPSAILGSPNSQNIAVESEGFENGWATIGFRNVLDGLDFNHFMESSEANTGLATSCSTTDSGDCYLGLPVTGFAVQVVRNNTLTDEAGASVLSNYAGLFKHRASRDITGS